MAIPSSSPRKSNRHHNHAGRGGGGGRGSPHRGGRWTGRGGRGGGGRGHADSSMPQHHHTKDTDNMPTTTALEPQDKTMEEYTRMQEDMNGAQKEALIRQMLRLDSHGGKKNTKQAVNNSSSTTSSTPLATKAAVADPSSKKKNQRRAKRDKKTNKQKHQQDGVNIKEGVGCTNDVNAHNGVLSSTAVAAAARARSKAASVSGSVSSTPLHSPVKSKHGKKKKKQKVPHASSPSVQSLSKSEQQIANVRSTMVSPTQVHEVNGMTTTSSELNATTAPSKQHQCDKLKHHQRGNARLPSKPNQKKKKKKQHFKNNKENVVVNHNDATKSEEVSKSLDAAAAEFEPNKQTIDNANAAANKPDKSFSSSDAIAISNDNANDNAANTASIKAITTTTEPATATVPATTTPLAAAPPKDETAKERTARLLREAREKSAAAKEKKRSKKSKKHDKWRMEQEAEKMKRAQGWHAKIEKENETTNLISQLIITEFLRQQNNDNDASKILTTEQVLNDPQASKHISEQSKKVNTKFYGSIQCRVKVSGLDRQDLNGRVGYLRHWDDEKEQFCVGLDTKKGVDCDVHYFLPESVEPLSSSSGNGGQRGGVSGKSSDKNVQSCKVELDGLFTEDYLGIGCRFVLDKSDVTALASATSIDDGLKAFEVERKRVEIQMRVEADKARRQEEEDRKQEEEYRKQDEEDRARRANRRAEEREERRQLNEDRRRKAAEVRAAERERESNRRHVEGARKKLEQLRAMFREEHEEQRRHFKEQISEALKEVMAKEMSPGIALDQLNKLLNELGLEFEDLYDSDDEDDTFADFSAYSQRYEDKHRRAKDEENRNAAETLGVEPDADERTLKVAYRKKALKYHPDKWRADSDHGMTKDDAEEHFKKLQNAYDHLMSRFDEEEEELQGTCEEEGPFEDEGNSDKAEDFAWSTF